MARPIGYISITAAALAFASTLCAQNYTLTLTGVGDGANNGSVYFSPYVGTISNSGGQQIYSGYLICDDFNTESLVGSSWNATETNAGNLNGTEKFAGETYTLSGTTYNTAQMYDAVAWLATQLVSSSNVTDPTSQGNLSFAIWDIMDGTAAQGDVLSEIQSAFAAINSWGGASSVEVFTPSPQNASQEFLVVKTPESPAAALLGFDLMSIVGLGFLLHRRLRRTTPQLG
ncbi:MAG TPA: hypothetical protein VFA65_11785 [Bryobacteraceae bacterium]|nr:hypothetical protein [Bryobacteraceae bacterium]